MANKRTRALSREEFEKVIHIIKTGFLTSTGEKVRPNIKIATALTLQGNIGLRIGDIVRFRLSDIVFESGRYRLDIVEEKTGKTRTFTVPTEVYIFLQKYALENNIKPQGRLFNVTVRAVQKHLQKVCDYLKLENISTHSFRKFFANEIYLKNDFNITLVKELLQHSSLYSTTKYLSVDSKTVEKALQNHIVIPV